MLCPLQCHIFQGNFPFFLLRPLTVLMKQTRQAVCAIKQYILLRCLWPRCTLQSNRQKAIVIAFPWSNADMIFHLMPICNQISFQILIFCQEATWQWPQNKCKTSHKSFKTFAANINVLLNCQMLFPPKFKFEIASHCKIRLFGLKRKVAFSTKRLLSSTHSQVQHFTFFNA